MSAVSGNVSVLPAPTRAACLQAPCARRPGMLLVLATTQQVTGSWPIPCSPSRLSLLFQGPRGGICDKEAASPRAGLPGRVGRGDSHGGPVSCMRTSCSRGLVGGGVCPGSLVWPGVEPGLESKVLPSCHYKCQVAPAAGQATAQGLGLSLP